ncbi:MAG TPA: hypothetical protein VFM79_13175 [Pelobium sp.]|nr:hypothetical protein [Pelobium sp.]
MISSQAPNKLSDILRDLKKFTSNNIMKAISENPHESRKNWMMWIFKRAGEKNNKNKNLQFWQQDNHPIECDTNEIIETRLNYIHENPVRSGMVWQAHDYVYSSAIDYCTDSKGLLVIDFI